MIQEIYNHFYLEKYLLTINSLYTQSKYRMVLQNLPELQPKSRILHIGCNVSTVHKSGLPHLIKQKFDSVDYIGLDLNEEFFDEFQIEQEFRISGSNNQIVGNCESLPLQDESIDFILALDVLDHIPDPQKSINEIFRVIKPEGEAIIVVPSLYKLASVKNRPDFSYIDNKRSTTEITSLSNEEWIKKIKDPGFQICQVTGFAYSLALPYLLWTEKQFVPQRFKKDIHKPTSGLHKDIIQIINLALSPEDSLLIDESLRQKISSVQSLKQLVLQYYPDLNEPNDQEVLWLLWTIPLTLRIHPDYEVRSEIKNSEEELLKIIKKNSNQMSTEALTRLRQLETYLNSPESFKQMGSNSLMIKVKKKI